MLHRQYTPKPKPKQRDREPPETAPKLERAGVFADCAEMGRVMAKSEPKRNPALLAMAKGERCLLRAVDGCYSLRNDNSTTVACHGNSSLFGKAMGRKADDCYSVWGCAACHEWLDRGPASKTEKLRIFLAAHVRQVDIWRELAYDPYQQNAASPKERAAAQWAIDQLKEK